MASTTVVDEAPNNIQNAISVNYTLKLEVQYDANPEQTAWILIDNDRDENIGHVTYADITTPYANQTIIYDNLLPGKYVFLVSDFMGDGMCCQEEINDHKNGYIIISEILTNGTQKLIWANNGNYGVGTETMFTLGLPKVTTQMITKVEERHAP